MGKGIMDPIDYAILEAGKPPIELPVDSEVRHARRGLAELFVFFYDSPLYSDLGNRRGRAYVRKWIRLVSDLIEHNGFISTIAYLASQGNLLYHSCIYLDGVLTYEPDDTLEVARLFHLDGYLRKYQQDSPESFIKHVGWLYNACVMLSKIPLTRPDLEEKSREAWRTRQTVVKDMSSIKADVLEGLRLAVAYLFDADEIDEFEGKHGPGSTAYGDKTIPQKEGAFCHSYQSLEITKYRSDEDGALLCQPAPAKEIEVPKDVSNMRPITAESVSMQLAQQKLKRFFYTRIDGGDVMASEFIKFADQTRSQNLALVGSVPHQRAWSPITVDLSAASDLLSVDVVASSFSGNLLHYLMCSRTWDVKSDKVLVTVNMFAGMGSAVTFPVQTLIFTGVALMATCASLYKDIFGFHSSWDEMLREFLTQDLTKQSDVYRYFKNICVYGDDIVVPAIATAKLFELLEELGLKVNYNKSFYGNSAGREACGVFALAGRDITPVRFRLPVWDETADWAVFSSLRDHANQAFKRGFTHLYRYCIRLMKNLKLFMAKADLVRKAVRVTNSSKEVTRIRLGTPEIPFEEFRGDNVDYIGVLSTRRTTTYSKQVFGPGGLGYATLTTWAPKTKTEGDQCDSYHYIQNRYNSLQRPDSDQVSHGRIPRGIRLVKRIVYRRSDSRGWAWVPGQS